jgi:hypothetical protein
MVADTIDDTLALSRWEGPALVAHVEGEMIIRRLVEGGSTSLTTNGTSPAFTEV